MTGAASSRAQTQAQTRAQTRAPKAAPKAYIFDVFGTLVDWRNSVAREVAMAFEAVGLTPTENGPNLMGPDPRGLPAAAPDPHAFADHWRGRYQPAMERIRSGGRGYIPLDDLHLENLDETLAHFGLEAHFDGDARRVLNTAWEKLTPWTDVVAGLRTLKNDAIIAPCSNGSIALMTRLAKYGDLPWDCILGADLAQNYKPEPQVYHACCTALRLLPGDVMMVACHNNDLAAARAAGLKTGFIPRLTEHGPTQTTDLRPEADWDRIVMRIGDLG
ncbi:MAG: HAD-IA family hydrolase [Pseudomonadota bacterium]